MSDEPTGGLSGAGRLVATAMLPPFNVRSEPPRRVIVRYGLRGKALVIDPSQDGRAMPADDANDIAHVHDRIHLKIPHGRLALNYSFVPSGDGSRSGIDREGHLLGLRGNGN